MSQTPEFSIEAEQYDIFCRIITEDCTARTEAQITAFFRDRLGMIDFSPMQPYCKIPGCGELSCQFTTSRSLEEIQRLLADHWESDTAEAGRSRIHCPGVRFLWICRS